MDRFKYVAQTHNVDNEKLTNLMKIVREFIIKKELILYGGLAIDYALRLKGDKIYDDYEHPDFDVFSPNHVEDCQEIVDKLYSMGFRNVIAIRAMHPQTMRVRCDFLYILDISYIPNTVFKKIPILKYNGITIVDPIYQMMDMHLSLCFPFSGFPENVTFRWGKDIKRFNIINKQYPPSTYLNNGRKLIGNKISKPRALHADNKNIKPKFIKLEVDLSTLPPFVVEDKHNALLAITGFGAYAIIRNSLDTIAKLFNINLKTTIPKLDIQFSKDFKKLSLEVPDIEGHNNINFITYKYISVINMIKNKERIERYKAYLDINFEYIHFKNIIISSTENSLISALFINHCLNETNSEKKGIYVVSIQHVLLYFLFQFHITDYNIYIQYYINTLKMITIAEKIFHSIIDKIDSDDALADKNGDDALADKNELKLKVMKIFNNSLFAPVISTFGNSNLSTTYIIQEGKKILDFHDEGNIPDIIGLKDINFEDIMNLPNNVKPSGTSKFSSNGEKNTNVHKKSFLNNILFNKDGTRAKNDIKNKFFD